MRSAWEFSNFANSPDEMCTTAVWPAIVAFLYLVRNSKDSPPTADKYMRFDSQICKKLIPDLPRISWTLVEFGDGILSCLDT